MRSKNSIAALFIVLKQRSDRLEQGEYLFVSSSDCFSIKPLLFLYYVKNDLEVEVEIGAVLVSIF